MTTRKQFVPKSILLMNWGESDIHQQPGFAVPVAKLTAVSSLRGLFIWAIDQDTLDNSLLNAVLQPDGLGKFAKKNGVGNDGQDWQPGSTSGCDWSGMWITSAHCRFGCRVAAVCALQYKHYSVLTRQSRAVCGGQCLGKVSVAQVRCPDTPDGSKPHKQLCCPPDNAPDPQFCHWRADKTLGFCTTNPHCNNGEALIATDTHYVDDKGNDQPCLFNPRRGRVLLRD